MKKGLAGLVTLCIVVLLIVFATKADFEAVDSLIRPPKIEGDNSKIQAAFELSVGEHYNLKSPLSGQYRSSFIRIDLDSDETDEVIVFYSQTDSVDVVRMNILDQVDGSWTAITDYESKHKDVHSVNFADVDGDGISEIIISWQTFENEIFNSVDVYKIISTDSGKNVYGIFSKSYNEFIVSDIDGDGKTDIIVFEKSSGNTATEIKGTLYAFGDEKFSSIGEFVVDPSISSIGAVCYDREEFSGDFRIFIDGYKTDTGMTTDIVKWDGHQRSFVHAQSDDMTSVSVLASRSKNIYCADINNDSFIEIPVEDYIIKSVVYDNSSQRVADTQQLKQQNVIKWVQYSDGEMNVISYEIFNSDYAYSIAISAEHFNGFTVKNDLRTGILTFYSLIANDEFENRKEKKPKKKNEPYQQEEFEEYEVGEKLFSVLATADQDFGMYELSGYRFIKSANGFSYYCQIYDSGRDYGITKEKIKSIIIT